MGKIINKKNVEIIIDGLELLRKYLQEISPVNNIFRSAYDKPDSVYTKYSKEDINNLIKDIKNADLNN
jgi:hypothetical protein